MSFRNPPQFQTVLTARRIVGRVEHRYNLSPGEIRRNAHRRPHHISHPRQIAVYLVRRYKALGWHDIGRLFGGMHHTSCMYAERHIRELIESAPEVARLVSSLCEEIERAEAPPSACAAFWLPSSRARL